jgi:hypothetical protein
MREEHARRVLAGELIESRATPFAAHERMVLETDESSGPFVPPLLALFLDSPM